MVDVVGSELRAPPKLWYGLHKNASRTLFASSRAKLARFSGNAPTRSVHMSAYYCSIPNIAGIINYDLVRG